MLLKWISDYPDVLSFDSHHDVVLNHMNQIPFRLNSSGKCWNASNPLQLQMSSQSFKRSYSLKEKKK